MPLLIRHSVIHGFSKEAREPVAQVTKKGELLDSTLPSVFSLVEGMAILLGKRESRQVWGRFGSDGREGPFPLGFTGFVGNLDDAANFLALSHLAVDEIARMAEEQQLSTGGHILCAAYDDAAGETRVIVAMIKQKNGLQLDENLVPVGIVEVDMSKLHQAALIRVGEFRRDAEQPDQVEGELVDQTYLSFVSQRADRDSSGYFVKALGCVVGVSPVKATNLLYSAVDTYFRERPAIADFRKTAKENLTTFLQQQADAQRPVTMDALYDVLSRAVPPDRADHVRDVVEILNSDRFKVPDNFHVSSTVVKRHTKVTLESERFSMKFDRALLGTDMNAELYFDQTNRTLTIRNLPDGIVRRLTQTLNDD